MTTQSTCLDGRPGSGARPRPTPHPSGSYSQCQLTNSFLTVPTQGSEPHVETDAPRAHEFWPVQVEPAYGRQEVCAYAPIFGMGHASAVLQTNSASVTTMVCPGGQARLTAPFSTPLLQLPRQHSTPQWVHSSQAISPLPFARCRAQWVVERTPLHVPGSLFLTRSEPQENDVVELTA